jgi:hypothetical protein
MLGSSNFIISKNIKYLFFNISKGKKPTDRKFESFQFMKHHGVGKYTAVNMIPTFFGVYNIYMFGEYFLSDYKKRGYITGQSLNFCGREVFDIDGGAIEHMKWDTYDHEMTSLFCDTNFTPYKHPAAILMGVNSIRKRCLYNENTTAYSLEYMWQFFQNYKNEPKLFRLGLVDGHEGSTEVIKYSDDLLVEFFTKFQNAGFLDDTAIFIQTDHGFSMVGPFSLLEVEDYTHDVVLPTFFSILPTNMRNYDMLRENLINNEQSITTPFTIYNSLKSILNDRNVVYFSMEESTDIFNHHLSKNRDCRTFYNPQYFYVNQFYCRCHK